MKEAPRIAILGMACRFPDARSPEELWETVLAQRAAFRRMPDSRLRLSDYDGDAIGSPDGTYVHTVGVLEGWSFDRAAFHVSGDAFRAADTAHWLALEVTRDALRDAGFVDGAGLPKESTGVFVGNSLTGEFSRANQLRLRWPFVRRMVQGLLDEEEWPVERRAAFLSRLEARFKAPFPAPGTESLAGALSNTIAGRICNFFDLSGAGYTVDGACASSLLAVITACNALAAHDLDVAIAGGVDLSLDPFELVGFARLGALARDEMRVYDEHSNGFWPGEGCGVVVLMRDEDATMQQSRRRGVIRGWGMSSDGSGGLTRPEVDGQRLALRRAYARAGVDIGTVGYFEGHGTGTAVGDAIEVAALTRARRAARAPHRAALGSVKANIGHTKAAAGVAGLIKATLALQSQILPPTTGCVEPCDALRGDEAALRAPKDGALWPDEAPLRAGVSAMGFGGVNAHVVVDAVANHRREALHPHERRLIASPQDAELFLIDADDGATLDEQLARLERIARDASRAELTDAAAALARAAGRREHRVAIVASTAIQLAERVARVRADPSPRVDADHGIFVARTAVPRRIGFLFPGQGSPTYRDAPALRRRYPAIDTLYRDVDLSTACDDRDTAVAQPAIVAASLAALHVLHSASVCADVAVGHSLGELTALHWAGALTAPALVRLAKARGRAMSSLASAGGAMAAIGAGADAVQLLIGDTSTVIAAINSPRSSVVSGDARDVDAICSLARARGWHAQRIAVSHAFHSPFVAAAEPSLAAHLALEAPGRLERRVFSTVAGRELDDADDLTALLGAQITRPVCFLDAFSRATDSVALWIEVGPGHILRDLATDCSAVPVVASDAGGPSWIGLLNAVAAAWVVDARVRAVSLFEPRFARPFDLDATRRFLSNPCEQAPVSELAVEVPVLASPPSPKETGGSTLDTVRRLVAQAIELPLVAIHDDHGLLRDLHLNSISVAEIAAEAAQALGRAPSISPTEFSLATVADLAAQLDARPMRADDADDTLAPPGVDAWVHPFIANRVPRPLVAHASNEPLGEWLILSDQRGDVAAKLREAFAGRGGSGVIVCASPERDDVQLSLLLDVARTVLAPAGARRIAFVQHDGGTNAFARTLFEEVVGATVCVVDIAPDHPRLAELVVAEVTGAAGFVEVSYNADGARHESELVPLSPSAAPLALGPDDVVLVTGGAAGITARCALALAEQRGACLALVGRTPETSAEVSAALETFDASGVRARYYRADVTDALAVGAAVRAAERDLGPVTAVIHGAGINEPRLLAELDLATARRTIAPKVNGLANILAAVDQHRLRLIAAFGSTIGRSGLRGAASYALANEWMALALQRLQPSLPGCRCLAIEWSVWSETGIGARSRQLDTMARAGVSPITPSVGAEWFVRLVATGERDGVVRVVVTGRYGCGRDGRPLMSFAQPPLPLTRFVERTRVHYDAVELVADAHLSVDTDPYLMDHVLDGRCVLPAVMGLEAMAQAARALTGSTSPITFERAEFDRAIVVPITGELTVRVAALVQDDGTILVAVRSAETGFKVDHFRAQCRFSPPRQAEVPSPSSHGSGNGAAIDARQMYDKLFFQRGRFQRVDAYSRLAARDCVAAIAPATGTTWFGPYHPPATTLGDPAARDAAIHAIQACYPHATLLPVGVDRIATATIDGARPLVVEACERAHEKSHGGETLVYDLDMRDAAGASVERWEGLRLRTVGARRPPTTRALLGPYFERRVNELFPFTEGALTAVVTARDDVHRARAGARRRRDSLRHGLRDVVRVDTTAAVLAYSTRQAFVVSGAAAASCDVAEVASRSTVVWRDLLTPERFILATLLAADAAEEFQHAATRVWAAAECLTKVGAPASAPLVLSAHEPDGWVTFRTGSDVIVTYAAALHGEPAPLVFAILLGGG